MQRSAVKPRWQHAHQHPRHGPCGTRAAALPCMMDLLRMGRCWPATPSARCITIALSRAIHLTRSWSLTAAACHRHPPVTPKCSPTRTTYCHPSPLLWGWAMRGWGMRMMKRRCGHNMQPLHSQRPMHRTHWSWCCASTSRWVTLLVLPVTGDVFGSVALPCNDFQVRWPVTCTTSACSFCDACGACIGRETCNTLSVFVCKCVCTCVHVHVGVHTRVCVRVRVCAHALV